MLDMLGYIGLGMVFYFVVQNIIIYGAKLSRSKDKSK